MSTYDDSVSSSSYVETKEIVYNDPVLALSEFKPNLYDLMLVDINMTKMNGFDFCVKALAFRNIFPLLEDMLIASKTNHLLAKLI